MEKYLCIPAGILLALAALAASIVTGGVAYSGFAGAIPGLPIFGVIGPVISTALVMVGIGLAAALQLRKWGLAAALAVGLVAGAWIERNGSMMAFETQVAEATQAEADRNAAYQTATEALAKVRAEIADLSAERDLMTSDRIAEAQTRLAALGLYRGKVDGARGPVTLTAMADRGAEVRKRLETLDADERHYAPIVEAGAKVTKDAFDLHQAELYATGLSVLSIVLAFLAPVVATMGQRKEPTTDEVLTELEETTSTLEAEVFDLAGFLSTVREKAA